MNGYLYILKSLKDKKTYVGSTDNLNRRIKQHKKGKVISTKNRIPLELIYYEEYKTLEEARYMEKFYKNCSGRKKLKELLKDKI